MAAPSKTEIVRAVFTAYRTKNRQVVEDALADDFTFTSPYDDAIDRAAYFERCWPNSECIATHVLEKIWQHGDEAVVQYRCVTKAGKEFRNTEFFRFHGDKIASVDVYFGRTLKVAA